MKRRQFLTLSALVPLALLPVTTRTVVTIPDGIYYGDVTIPATEIWQATSGANPLFIGGDGYPAHISILGQAKGLWFGGTKQTFSGKTISFGNDAIVDGCTIFGYAQALSCGSNNNLQIINNRFVNCGLGLYSHPIYVSSGGGYSIMDNVFVGCEGYPIHVWRDAPLIPPGNNTVQRNFVGNSLRAIATRGNNNVVRDNIFWGINSLCSYLQDGIAFRYQHNLHRKTVDSILNCNLDAIVKNNGFSNAAVFGTGADEFSKADLNAMGIEVGNINNSLSALENSFAQSITSIRLDSMIEPYFFILKQSVQSWNI